MIKDIIINYLPAFVLGFVFVFCTFKYIGTFKNMCNDIKETTSYKKLENEFRCLMGELYEERKTNKELKEQIMELKDDLIKLGNEYELKLEHKEEE